MSEAELLRAGGRNHWSDEMPVPPPPSHHYHLHHQQPHSSCRLTMVLPCTQAHRPKLLSFSFTADEHLLPLRPWNTGPTRRWPCRWCPRVPTGQVRARDLPAILRPSDFAIHSTSPKPTIIINPLTRHTQRSMLMPQIYCKANFVINSKMSFKLHTLMTSVFY